MGASVQYPDGSTLNSSALTLQQINTIMHPLTLGMLGLLVVNNSAKVRIEYPTEGAPFGDVSDDVCYIRCMIKDDPYDKIRDKYYWPQTGKGYGQGPYGQMPYGEGDPNTTIAEQWNYTRVWAIRWCFYGPNSTDNARVVRSGLYQDYFTNSLSKVQLFPMSDFPAPVRAPEEIDAQWFERVDLEVEMYEFVTEVLSRQTILISEVIVETAQAAVGYGQGPYGEMPYGEGTSSTLQIADIKVTGN